jgi:hypothetical protein
VQAGLHGPFLLLGFVAMLNPPFLLSLKLFKFSKDSLDFQKREFSIGKWVAHFEWFKHLTFNN